MHDSISGGKQFATCWLYQRENLGNRAVRRDLRLVMDHKLGRSLYFDIIARYIYAALNCKSKATPSWVPRNLEEGRQSVSVPLQDPNPLGWTEWGQPAVGITPYPWTFRNTAGTAIGLGVPPTFPLADLTGHTAVAKGTQTFTLGSWKEVEMVGLEPSSHISLQIPSSSQCFIFCEERTAGEMISAFFSDGESIK